MDDHHTHKALETIYGNRKPSINAGGLVFIISKSMCLLAAISLNYSKTPIMLVEMLLDSFVLTS